MKSCFRNTSSSRYRNAPRRLSSKRYNIEITDQIDVIQSKLFKGAVICRLHESDSVCALIHLDNKRGIRTNNDTENEFSVIGPKVGFVEDEDTNLSLIRALLQETAKSQ
ncbi:spore germination protein [Paenibacillus sp. CF384]|uniref:spore germination protein n=1 Tax=Paenibacillus sp. CF384 TaxID=1884382 RepID=UPI00115FB9D9